MRPGGSEGLCAFPPASGASPARSERSRTSWASSAAPSVEGVGRGVSGGPGWIVRRGGGGGGAKMRAPAREMGAGRNQSVARRARKSRAEPAHGATAPPTFRDASRRRRPPDRRLSPACRCRLVRHAVPPRPRVASRPPTNSHEEGCINSRGRGGDVAASGAVAARRAAAAAGLAQFG